MTSNNSITSVGARCPSWCPVVFAFMSAKLTSHADIIRIINLHKSAMTGVDIAKQLNLKA